MLPAVAAPEHFNKDRSDLVVLLFQMSGVFLCPLGGIPECVQFPGQGYFEFIGMHGYSPEHD
jgi:hypothetical protein